MPYYYICINFISKLTKEKCFVGFYDISEKDLSTIAEPYMNDEEFIVSGIRIDPQFVEIIRVFETEKKFAEIMDDELLDNIDEVCKQVRLGNIGKEVTSKFILHPPKKQIVPKQEKTTEALCEKKLSRNIFIVHGRADKPKLELARMLEELGFEVTILSELPDKGRTLIEKLEQETIDVGYAFVILTPDDMGCLYDEMHGIATMISGFSVVKKEIVENIFKLLYPRSRQNVILELGYFVGKLGRNKVCCLYQGDVQLPSDIHGVVYKKFNESLDECFRGIVKELKAVGYEIKV